MQIIGVVPVEIHVFWGSENRVFWTMTIYNKELQISHEKINSTAGWFFRSKDEETSAVVAPDENETGKGEHFEKNFGDAVFEADFCPDVLKCL